MDMDTRLLQEISDKLSGLGDLNRRFDGLNERFGGLNERFEGLNERFDGLNERFDGLNARFDGLNERFDDLNGRVDANGRNIEAVHSTLVEMKEQNQFVVRYLKALTERDSQIGTEVARLKHRVDVLEEHAGLKDEI